MKCVTRIKNYELKKIIPMRPCLLNKPTAQKRAEKNGAKKSKERREEVFSPFFTFLRAIFFRPFSLSLAPTICPWVSEDA